jgi:hypothetical protein
MVAAKNSRKRFVAWAPASVIIAGTTIPEVAVPTVCDPTLVKKLTMPSESLSPRVP